MRGDTKRLRLSSFAPHQSALRADSFSPVGEAFSVQHPQKSLLPREKVSPQVTDEGQNAELSASVAFPLISHDSRRASFSPGRSLFSAAPTQSLLPTGEKVPSECEADEGHTKRLRLPSFPPHQSALRADSFSPVGGSLLFAREKAFSPAGRRLFNQKTVAGAIPLQRIRQQEA